MATTKMRIGELARRAGVNIQTVRYYERRGLLTEPERRPSGYREYTEDCLERLQFIRRAQGLGFTLSEITGLLSLRQDEQTTADQVKARAEEKIADVEQKILDLQQIQRALTHLAGRCEGGTGPAGECPLLEAMGPIGHTCTHAPDSKRGQRADSRPLARQEESSCGCGPA